MKKFIFMCALAIGACMYSTTAIAVTDYDVSPSQVVPAPGTGYVVGFDAPDSVYLESPAQVVAVPSVEIEKPYDFTGIFATFLALVAFIPIAVQFVRRYVFKDSSGFGAQILSWFVGLAVTMLGWTFNLGFLTDLSWWMALIYGLGACLAANGIFDTGLVSAIIGLVKKK